MAANSQYLLSHSFCGLGVQGQLSWVPLVQVFLEAAVKLSVRGMRSSEGSTGRLFGRGEKPFFQAHRHDCWQTSVPHHMGLSIELLHNMAAAFPPQQAIQEREKRVPNWKPWSFYKLIWKRLPITFVEFLTLERNC